jgi:cell filamentation protein
LADDPFEIYFYPGTEVLRNIPGIKRASPLERFERNESRARLDDLPNLEISATGFNAIHKHLFGNIYDWAGQNRTVNMGKGSSSFLPPRYIEGAMYKQFDELKKDNNLKGLSIPDFADRASHYIAEINYIHPFREGNGRTMRAFLTNLSHQAGLRFENQLMHKDDWIGGSIRAHQDPKDIGLLQSTIQMAIPGRLPTPQQALASARDPERRAKMQALYEQLRATERGPASSRFSSREDEIEK